MAKYLVRFTETINHDYVVEADSPEDATGIVQNYSDEQLKELDIDNQSSWDSYPWDIEEVSEEFASEQDLNNKADTK
jgi:hypothetical protein